MKAPPGPPERQDAEISGPPEDAADLRQRLRGSQEQALAARTEARRLARELALTRRLLGFFLGQPAPPRPAPVRAEEAEPSLPTALPLALPVTYHLDSCRTQGARTVITGWAFRPAPEWDARAASVTLVFRHGAAAYHARARRQPRPDVAAHYAARPAAESGGARGLDGAGFTCEFASASLPAGVDWEITLRLEGAGVACEQPTAQTLRL